MSYSISNQHTIIGVRLTWTFQTFVLHQQNQFVTAYLTKLASCNCLQLHAQCQKTLLNTITLLIHYPGI